MAHPMTLEIGARLGVYEVTAKIGEGLGSSIGSAEDDFTGLVVVLQWLEELTARVPVP